MTTTTPNTKVVSIGPGGKQRLHYVVMPSQQLADINTLVTRLPKRLCYQIESSDGRFGSASEPIDYLPFQYASSDTTSQRIDKLNCLIEIVCEYYEEHHGLGTMSKEEVGRHIRKRLNHCLDDPLASSDIAAVADPIGVHSTPGSGTSHRLQPPGLSLPQSPRVQQPQRMPSRSLSRSPSADPLDHGRDLESNEEVKYNPNSYEEPRRRQSTPFSAGLSYDKLNEVHRGLLKDLQKSFSWNEADRLDPATKSIHVWKRKLTSDLRSVPHAIRALHGEADLEDHQDNILSALIQKTLSDVLIARLHQNNTMKNYTAQQLYEWAINECTAFSNDRQSKLSLELITLQWDQRSDAMKFLLKFERTLNEFMEYLEEPWPPIQRYNQLMRAFPGDQRPLLQTIFVKWRDIIYENGNTLSESQFNKILEECRWLITTSTRTIPEKKSETVMLAKDDKSGIDDKVFKGLALAAYQGKLVCWACNTEGHAVSKCPDAKAKKAYEQRRDRQAGERGKAKLTQANLAKHDSKKDDKSKGEKSKDSNATSSVASFVESQ